MLNKLSKSCTLVTLMRERFPPQFVYSSLLARFENILWDFVKVGYKHDLVISVQFCEGWIQGRFGDLCSILGHWRVSRLLPEAAAAADNQASNEEEEENDHLVEI